MVCLVMFVGGTAWIGILACFKLRCPNHGSDLGCEARSLSMYLLVMQGGCPWEAPSGEPWQLDRRGPRH